ncbi:hypothetical protein ACE198_11015 [Neobacillus sp. KR4-4]
MFFAYLFSFGYIIGSVWATYAIIKGCIEADDEFIEVPATK